jgi:glycosyltransferase involved in cell wall biosynthesis
MRIILILNDYCYVNGGASKVAIDEAVALAGADVRVVFLGAVGPVCPQLANSEVEVACLEQPELLSAGSHPAVLLQGLWNQSAYRRVGELLATLNPADTVVHLHGYTKALTTSPVRAAVKAGFSVVCTLHDFFAACPNGAFFDYVERKPCPRTALSMDCITTNCDKRHYAHKLYRVARGAVQRGPGMLPRGVVDYITLSKGSAEILAPYLPTSAQLHPLENIIETVEAPPVDVKANTAVVAVGRLDVEKGIETLIEAARRTGQELLLVGDGPLRQVAEAYERCRVTGWVTPAEVIEYLKTARCLVFPSIWYETYGLVVSEAAALGVPAIVSDISAAAERVEDGVTGWIMRAGDVDDITRCFQAIKDDKAIGSAGAAAYRRFWSDPPTAVRHAAELRFIYETVLARRKVAKAA